MTKVVFPTQEKLSYISTVENQFCKSNYLTILHCKGQKIDGVDIIKNPFKETIDGFSEFCKKKKFDVLVSIDNNQLPIEELSTNGISVFNAKKSEMVLTVFSDFVQDKLQKLTC